MKCFFFFHYHFFAFFLQLFQYIGSNGNSERGARILYILYNIIFKTTFSNIFIYFLINKHRKILKNKIIATFKKYLPTWILNNYVWRCQKRLSRKSACKFFECRRAKFNSIVLIETLQKFFETLTNRFRQFPVFIRNIDSTLKQRSVFENVLHGTDS